MPYPDPVLEPPFLPALASAKDPQFPVRITQRAQRHLFWHIVNAPQYFGPGLLFERAGALQVASFRFADVAQLDRATHRHSFFGRVPIAVALEDESAFAGLIVDAISFPPGPRLHLFRETGQTPPDPVHKPGKFRLDLERLRALHPELFEPASLITKALTSLFRVTSWLGSQPGDFSWMNRWLGPWDPEGQAQAIEHLAERLWFFGIHPAVVVSEEPWIIAAYPVPLDNVILLELPKALRQQGPRGRPWLIGDRMISCTGFDWTETPSGDIPLGPKADWYSNECWCVLADLLTSDTRRLDEAKAELPEELWVKCRDLGSRRWAQGAPVRDGRPWLARVAVRDQSSPQWWVKGGYLGRKAISPTA